MSDLILNQVLEVTPSQEIYQKLIQQLDKDFRFTGISYDFETIEPQYLMNALVDVVEHLLSKEYATFLNLLYRIDIPESKVKPIDGYTLEQSIAILIVKRQWLKVQLRMKYSS